MKTFIIERRETKVFHVTVELPNDEPNALQRAEIIGSVGPYGRLREKEYVTGVVLVDEPYTYTAREVTGKELRKAKARLEYLRGELDAECISQGELCELQSLAPYIDPSDVQLLEAAGVPEHGYE